jgi:predicted RNA-binding Zn-ribbon protein involved in translation (DUF1610 family)
VVVAPSYFNLGFVRSRPVASVSSSLYTGECVPSIMPKTLEIECTSADCELDMFELHYTYDMPDETTVADFSCPYCGRSDSLEEIVV